jgi:hypothetical protein
MPKISGTRFDLIVDDGLHAPIANLRSVIYAAELLAEGGVLVVEDVALQSLPVWETLLPIISNIFSGEIVKTKFAYLVILTKK